MIGTRALPLLLVGLLPAAALPALAEPILNAFDLAGASVAADEILPGGPPRDGIPSLDAPDRVPAEAAPWDDAVPGDEPAPSRRSVKEDRT